VDPAATPATPVAAPVPRRVITFILLLMLIDAMGIGISVPVWPRLIMELTGSVVAGAAGMSGVLMAAYAVMQFLFAPVLGNLSDRFGRRPVLLGSLAALFIDYLIMGLAPNMGWLFVGRILAGSAGATYPTANAVIADVTPGAGRARYYGMIGAAWGVGFILGPVFGGLLGGFGSRVPFFAAAGLVVLNLVLGLVVFRETLGLENRRPFALRRSHLLAALRELRAYPVALLLLVVVVLYEIAHDVLPATWTFYMVERFHSSPREIGLSLAAVGVCTAIVQGGLVGPITRRLGEARSVYLGLLVGAASMLGYAFAPTLPWLLAAIAAGSFIGLTMPAVQSVMTRNVAANAQGELQGAIAGIGSLIAIVAPVAMTQLFRSFASANPPFGWHLPGAAFIAGALVLVAAVFFFRRAMARAAPAVQP
jgi:DHA1 family tetracycline resistance protein-like MFS transporter